MWSVLLLFSINCKLITYAIGQCSPVGNIQYGKFIVGNTILSLNKIGFKKCIKECKNMQNCRSVDYNRNTFICDLKSKTMIETGTITEQNAWIWHIDMDKVIQMFTDCTGLGCQIYDKCIKDHCISSGCSSIPTLKNGEVLPTDRLACSGNRTFKCLVGYKGRGNPNVQISNSSIWSSNNPRCYKSDGEWILLARFMTGIGSSVYNSWLSVGTSSETNLDIETGCASMNYTATCTNHYRTGIIDEWTSLDITEVKLELFKLGDMVANIHFTGVNTSSTSWFSIDNYISSGWTDIHSSQTILYFSLEGDSNAARRFFIHRNYGGCAADAGWIAISENSVCDWDYGTSIPTFSYSSLMTYSSGSQYKRADVMAISVKADSFP